MRVSFKKQMNRTHQTCSIQDKEADNMFGNDLNGMDVRHKQANVYTTKSVV